MKKLVLFSDGTGNSSAKAEKTNVWRMFDALDQTSSDQLAKYDDGVGTSSIKLLAALGGAFGFGLKRNVIDLYKFVCRNHRAGDEIHGFGFSRGAFTIRSVVGLIATQGLVRADSEAELQKMALSAYREYRRERFPSHSPLVWIARFVRDLVMLPFNRAERAKHLSQRAEHRAQVAKDLAQRLPRHSLPIKFLGLFDTVGAYGMPIDELKKGISMVVWPMVSIDHRLFECVERACHALALDEQRETFNPTLFDEAWEAHLVKTKRVPPGRLTQVWFAGVHSNVGGGYPEDKASLVPLDWMMSQAIDAGLRFDAAALPQVAQDKSSYARLYDSRAGLAAYYRYAPRRIELGHYPAVAPDKALPIRAIVHSSVLMRMDQGSDAYAPISLPRDFDVLAPDGSLLPMHGFAYADVRDAMREQRAVATTASKDIVTERTAALKQAIASLGTPEPGLVEQVGDTVWWRRVTYFACLVTTLLLVAFPKLAPLYASALEMIGGWLGLPTTGESPLQATDQIFHGSVTGLLELAGPLIPSYLQTWVRAFEARPAEMFIALLLVAIPYLVGVELAQRIHDRAWFAWHADRRRAYLAWLDGSARRARAGGLAAWMALSAVLIYALSARWQGATIAAIGVAMLCSGVFALWRVGICVHIRRVIKHADEVVAAERARSIAVALPIPVPDGPPEASPPGIPSPPSTPTLRFASLLRRSAWLVALYTGLAENVVPFVFGVGVLVAGACVAYHAAYLGASDFGEFCTGSIKPVEAVASTASAAMTTSAMCSASGLKVHGGTTYEVTLTQDTPWFDHTIQTDVAGFPGVEWRHLSAAPMKRLWTADWFVPILRIGDVGGDDLKMLPEPPSAARVTYPAYAGPEVPTFEPVEPSRVKSLAPPSTDNTPQGPTTATVKFVAPYDGELFVYVNDAVLLWPGLSDLFYRNNAGRGTLTVKRIEEAAAP